jgi:hypothetical protein
MQERLKKDLVIHENPKKKENLDGADDEFDHVEGVKKRGHHEGGERG